MIAFFASDLMWNSRISGACQAQGIPCRPLTRAQDAAGASGAIIDLAEPETGLTQLGSLREQHPELPIVAFAPHVDRSTIERAQALGASQVLPRGAFAQRLPEIVAELADRD